MSQGSSRWFEVMRSRRNGDAVASSMEGGAGAWVGHIPLTQQHAQGGLIASFLARYRIQPGMQYRIVVAE